MLKKETNAIRLVCVWLENQQRGFILLQMRIGRLLPGQRFSAAGFLQGKGNSEGPFSIHDISAAHLGPPENEP